MCLDFKNNIKNFKTTSLAICQMNLSRTMSWTVFPIIYANLHSKGCFQLCCQVWPPIISTIDSYMSIFKIWEIITEIFDSWKKNNPKNGNIFQFFLPYSKGHHISITKLYILIFCNILHLEMDFESWVEKGWFPHKRFDKNLV